VLKDNDHKDVDKSLATHERQGHGPRIRLVSDGGKIRPRISVVQQDPSYEYSLSVEANQTCVGLIGCAEGREKEKSSTSSRQIRFQGG
jgi:hypothetical protein